MALSQLSLSLRCKINITLSLSLSFSLLIPSFKSPVFMPSFLEQGGARWEGEFHSAVQTPPIVLQAAQDKGGVDVLAVLKNVSGTRIGQAIPSSCSKITSRGVGEPIGGPGCGSRTPLSGDEARSSLNKNNRAMTFRTEKSALVYYFLFGAD